MESVSSINNLNINYIYLYWAVVKLCVVLLKIRLETGLCFAIFHYLIDAIQKETKHMLKYFTTLYLTTTLYCNK